MPFNVGFHLRELSAGIHGIKRCAGLHGATGRAGLCLSETRSPGRGYRQSDLAHRKERDDADEPGQLVRLLSIKSGMTVADIGTGTGYYSGCRRSSDQTAASSPKISCPSICGTWRKRVRDLGLQNVIVSRGEPHNSRLPAGSVDIAILVHMYHEIAQPYALLYNLVPALRPDARVGIVDAFGPTGVVPAAVELGREALPTLSR
jgi:SAM-dependent methyltransferase